MLPFYTQTNYYNPQAKDKYLVKEVVISNKLEDENGFHGIEHEAVGVYINGRRQGEWNIYSIHGNLLRTDTYEKGQLTGTLTYPVPKFPSKEDKRRQLLALMEKKSK